MSARAELLEKAEPQGHIVQLYGDDDRALMRSVGLYLGEGLKRGDGLLVIATKAHRLALARQLRKEGGDPIEAAQEGRLVILDAQATLARVMVDGQPDWDRFESVVGGAASELRGRVGHPRLRAFGEMVGLLWQAGQFAEAIRLEEYWNRLLKAHAFSLFCAYPIDVFGPEFQEDTVHALLCAHTDVVPANRDLETSVDRAIAEVLGPKAEGLRPLIGDSDRPPRAMLPRAEATILWLRRNLRDDADEILGRARRYSHALRSRRFPAKSGLLKTGDAARLLGTTTRTLLFYEEEGLVRPRRTTGGSRMYSQFDLTRAEIAIRLSRLGFPIKLIKRLAQVRPAASSGIEAGQERAALLEDLRQEVKTRISEFQALADDLDRADVLVREYETCPHRPHPRTDPQCACEQNLGQSAVLHLLIDPDPEPSAA